MNKMKPFKVIAPISAALLALAIAAPAPALSVDQVIRLRKAGVSNETIANMLDAETKSRQQGYIGQYVVRQKSGKKTVVYEASSNQGIVEYPTTAAEEAGGVEPVSTVLGFPSRVRVQGGVVSKTSGQEVSQALPGGGYTVHLTSYRNRKYAQRDAEVFKSKGLDATVNEVQVKDKGVMYRVSVGSFKNSKAAKAYGQQLKTGGKVSGFWVGKR